MHGGAGTAGAPRGASLANTVVERLLDARVAQYEGALDLWNRVEKKAQGVGALAGGFIGAVFAFIRGVDAATIPQQRWLLVLALALLIVAVLFAVSALAVRSVPGRPLGAVATTLEHLRRVGDEAELERRLEVMRDETLDAWRVAAEAMSVLNAEKARRVDMAQEALVLAVGVVVALSVWILLGA